MAASDDVALLLPTDQVRSEDGDDPPRPEQMDAIYSKIAWRVLPLLCTMVVCCYVDRTNLSFAAIQLTADLGISKSVYGVGAGIFFITYSTLQIPSNLILYRMGAPNWLATLIVLWGGAAAAFAFIRSEHSFLVLRAILGAAESGAFPGMWYYLGLMFPKHRVALPYAIVEASITVANCVAAPIAAGLLALDGLFGLRGWQLVFLCEGLPTIALGIAIYCLLPANPLSARFLTPADARAVAADIHTNGPAAKPSTLTLLRAGLSNSHTWWMGTAKGLNLMTTYGTLFFGPMIISSMLHRDQRFADDPQESDASAAAAPASVRALLESSGTSALMHHGHAPAASSADTGVLEVLLTAIPFALASAATYLNGRAAERRGRLKPHVVLPFVLGGLGSCVLAPITHASAVAGFVVYTVIVCCTNCTNGPFISWVNANNCALSAPVGLALYNSVGQLGGLFGPPILGFSHDRYASYTPGMLLLGALNIVAGLMLIPLPDHVAAAAKQGAKGVGGSYEADDVCDVTPIPATNAPSLSSSSRLSLHHRSEENSRVVHAYDGGVQEGEEGRLLVGEGRGGSSARV